MEEFLTNSVFFGAVLSFLAYEIGLLLKKRFKLAVLNPLLIGILCVMGALAVLRIDYDQYNEGAQYISYLLTPATVCLAVPLYKQIHLLKAYKAAVAASIGVGVLVSAGCVFLLSRLLGLSHTHYVTLLPKSITTAIGMGVSEEAGGIVTLTVMSIVLTGIFGSMICEAVLKVFHVSHPAARGLAIGTSAHAVGTAKALEMGEIEGAMSSLSIAVAGLMTVIVAPAAANLM